jgi:hypothetical protein
MSTSPLSIFSFETVQLGARPRGTTRTLAVAALFVTVAELGARAALAPISVYGRYWSIPAAMKFETYRRRAAAGVPPDIVVVGDSTGSGDIDPTSMTASLGSLEIFNLATPGNLPPAFRACTLPLLAADDLAPPNLVLVSLLPTGFIDDPAGYRFERAIISSRMCRQLRGEWTFDTTVYLTRLIPALPQRNLWWTGGVIDAPAAHGFEGFVAPAATDAYRAAALRTVEIRQAAEGRAVDPARFAVWDDLARVARRRRFRVIAVVPPLLHATSGVPPFELSYMKGLQAKAVEHGFRVFDYRYCTFLRPDHFYDAAHLNVTGARLLSVDLARRVAAFSDSNQ